VTLNSQITGVGMAHIERTVGVSLPCSEWV
jgi:hypothetical protein